MKRNYIEGKVYRLDNKSANPIDNKQSWNHLTIFLYLSPYRGFSSVLYYVCSKKNTFKKAINKVWLPQIVVASNVENIIH